MVLGDELREDRPAAVAERRRHSSKITSRSGVDSRRNSAAFSDGNRPRLRIAFRTCSGVTSPRNVAILIGAVTDDKSLPKAERKRLQIEYAARAIPRAKLLKLADKISNLKSLAASPPADWDNGRALEYVDWAEQVVAGCRGVNADLDTLLDAPAAEARGAISSRT